MQPICIGEYVLEPSTIEMYRVEETGVMDSGHIVSIYLKNGNVIRECIKDEEELEGITEALYDALKEKE